MQKDLIAGDALDFATTVPDYPPADGWTLTYRLVPQSSGTAYTFNATPAADGQSYEIAVSSTTTAGWAAGNYSWVAFVIQSGERHVVDQGTLTIKPDPVTTATLDVRGHARKVLDAIEAVLENRASIDQKSVTIGDRSLERTPIEDLLKLRQLYQAEVAREDAAARLAVGLSPRNRIYVRI